MQGRESAGRNNLGYACCSTYGLGAHWCRSSIIRVRFRWPHLRWVTDCWWWQHSSHHRTRISIFRFQFHLQELFHALLDRGFQLIWMFRFLVQQLQLSFLVCPILGRSFLCSRSNGLSWELIWGHVFEACVEPLPYFCGFSPTSIGTLIFRSCFKIFA